MAGLSHVANVFTHVRKWFKLLRNGTRVERFTH